MGRCDSNAGKVNGTSTVFARDSVISAAWTFIGASNALENEPPAMDSNVRVFIVS